ncbi:MAG TPA: hypothetical protein DCQ06_06425 [Myxococcales bacterium]|nr:hypothetical protein [Myxococcales bacterium]
MDAGVIEMTSKTDNLSKSIIVAVPGLDDPFFSRTVILLVNNDSEGSSGVILNRQAPMDLSTLLDDSGFSLGDATREVPVWWGGPVQPEGGMVLYRHEQDMPDYEPWEHICGELRVSWSMQLLQEISEGRGPQTYSFFIGRASWVGGQLEAELSQGSWLPIDLDPSLLFDLSDDASWSEALERLGGGPQVIAPGVPAQA